LAIDEIFFRDTPILMGVCPHSFAWVLGQKGPDRSGATWTAALTGWESVQRVLSDGGTGLAKGVAALQQRQKASGRPPCSAGLDVFHLKREGSRALRRVWAQAEVVWQAADEADRRWRRKRRKTGDNRGAAVRSYRAWEQAEAAYAAADRQEQGWHRIVAALEWFRPDGCLNERQWAEGEIVAASRDLTHAAWDKVKRTLDDPRTLSFLDEVAGRLATAVPDAELRTAVVERWRLRHGRGERTALRAVQEAVQTEVCRKMSGEWRAAYDGVRAVLGRAVRASSAVECVNSVLRMQQARQRNVSQGMLDLKRLWWNTRRFGSGKRKRKSPYELLGVVGVSDFWSVLNANPEALARQLGVVDNAENLSSS